MRVAEKKGLLGYSTAVRPLQKEIEEEIGNVLAEGEPTCPVAGREVPASVLLGLPKEQTPLTKCMQEKLSLQLRDWQAAQNDCLMICQQIVHGIRRYKPLHKDDFTVRRIAFLEALNEMGLRVIEEGRFAADTLNGIRILPSSGP